MKNEETAFLASDLLSGDGKKYVEVAKRVLPILVRQAAARSTITYSALAAEIEMPNPRNMNYPLGAVGQTLEKVGKEMGLQIPQIQALVVNKNRGVPGDGYFPFLKNVNLSSLTPKDKKDLAKQAATEIFLFDKWPEVLRFLGLKEVKIPRIPITVYGSAEGGEGPEHKDLKQFCYDNPKIFGATWEWKKEMEFQFPSCDSIDVAFMTSDQFLGLEVKSRISNEDDMVRGIFQCVKYKALAEALATSENRIVDVEIHLVLENEFPRSLLPLKNSLDINVIENVRQEIQTTPKTD